jgi:hypothetical protein
MMRGMGIEFRGGSEADEGESWLERRPERRSAYDDLADFYRRAALDYDDFTGKHAAFPDDSSEAAIPGDETPWGIGGTGPDQPVELDPDPDEMYPPVRVTLSPSAPPPWPAADLGVEGRGLGGRRIDIDAGRDVYEARENMYIFAGAPAPPSPKEPGKPVRLPMRPSPLVGRDRLLDGMLTSLASRPGSTGPRITVLCGKGGIGKTSVAVEYAYRRLPDVGAAWYLSVDNPDALSAGFGDLAAELQDGRRDRGRDPVAAVHAALATREGGWLLIFDNAFSPRDLGSLLPPAGDGEVIITSQHPFWPGRFAIELPPLEPGEAAQFLISATGHGELDAAGELAEELGCLPLALAQAVGYMRAAGRSIGDYLALYRARGAEMRGRGEAAGSDKVIATTWSLAFDEIARTTPCATGLLRLLACFAPDDIPVRLLLGPERESPEIPSPQVAPAVAALLDEVTLDDAISALRGFCLIAAPSPEGSLSVHRLVQQVTLDRLELGLADAWRAAAQALVEATLPDDPRDPRSWPACAALLPHARATVPPARPAAERIARYVGHSGRPAAARDLLREVAAAREQEHGADHPSTLTACGHLAYWTGRAGDPGAAQEQFAYLVPRLSRTLGPEHEHTLTARCNLARWTQRAGDAASARDLFAGLAADLSVIRGPHHPETLAARDCLAVTTGLAGNPAGACALYAALLEDLDQVNATGDHFLAPAARRKLARWVKTAAQD